MREETRKNNTEFIETTLNKKQQNLKVQQEEESIREGNTILSLCWEKELCKWHGTSH